MRITIAAVLAVAMLHAGGWFGFYKTVAPPDIANQLEYVSYTPYRDGTTIDNRRVPSADEIDRDLALLSDVARGVRTYMSTGPNEVVPVLARRHGLNVTLGAWLGREPAQNTKELDTAVALAKANRNVKALIVGSETLLRRDMPVEDLIAYIRQAKKRVKVPVSTGEVWDIWLKNPQLAKEVDFIAAHVLSYWEAVPADSAVQHAIERYDELKRAFPGKKILIAEFGWPSRGYNNRIAVPNPVTQAEVIRRFVIEAEKRGMPYNIIEAFDQPWKTDEGSVGPYWGMFDADRNAKFTLAGQVDNAYIWPRAALALAVGGLLTLAGLRRRRPGFLHAALYGAVANALAIGFATAAFYPFEHYVNFGTAIMWGLGIILYVPLVWVTLTKVHEIGEVIFGPKPRRLVKVSETAVPGQAAPGGAQPFVTIHVPACRESPAMMAETLKSLAALDYDRFEVVVVVNNTPDEAMVRPIEALCRELGARFKFLNFPSLTGAKAGALNKALDVSDPSAEVVAVIDADYVVHPRWLADLVPCFADPMVALVQAPQDHRDGRETVLKGMMNSEYAGFFDIGMVQRNEDNAIITHGTMCMVRLSALQGVGGWRSETIVEDTDLGLRLLEAGYRTLYTNRRYGWGLLPDTYRAYKAQRRRWAAGAMQLVRLHWAHVRPGSRSLTTDQKSHFISGWAFWIADGLGAAAAILNLLWVPVVLFVGVLLPTAALSVPIVASFAVYLLHSAILYGARVRHPDRTIVGAALAGMSLQLAVAQAVLSGLFKNHLPFLRTDKGGVAKKKAQDHSARNETILGLLLMVGGVALILTNKRLVDEVTVYAVTLVVQSIPMLSATVMRGMERFQDWRAARALARVAQVPAPAEAPKAATAETMAKSAA